MPVVREPEMDPRRRPVQRALRPIAGPLGGELEQAPAVARRRVRRRGGRRRAGRRRWLRFALAAVLLVVLLWLAVRAVEAWQSYQDVKRGLATIERIESRPVDSLTSSDLARLETTFIDLSRAFDRLDALTALPVGVGGAVHRLPYIGPRYDTARDLVRVGGLVSSAGAGGLGVAREALAAFEETGITPDADATSPTWIEAVRDGMPELGIAAERVAEANALRDRINVELIPDQYARDVERLDAALATVDVDNLVHHQLPAVLAGLGADRPVRYLMLFQNPAELRPSGGFPGTVALVELRRGQLGDYAFSDVKVLNNDYVTHRSASLPLPWPLRQNLPFDDLAIHDATWWADFPRSARQVMAMYAESGWPPIDGVVAVEPALVADLLELTGPVIADVDGEQRLITPDNVEDEIERQRRLERAGADVTVSHKQVVAIIGEEVIDRLKVADQKTLLEAARVVTEAADARDVQIYVVDPAVQELIAERGWDGSLEPRAGVPTIAVTFANVAFGKSSERLRTAMSITLGPSAATAQEFRLDLQLTNTGRPDEDPFYGGLQRWWIQIALPEGAVVTASSVPPQADPDAPNGGSYVVELAPQQSATLSIEAAMPGAETLVVRRQPGLYPVALSVASSSCAGMPLIASMTEDVTIELPALCAAAASGPRP